MLWRREKFNYLGLSNFSLDQTKEIINLIETNCFDVPFSYYQGMYNLISRKVEEIFPLLRENNIEFWAYNPLAGGLLTGKYRDFKNSSEIIDDSRFKNNSIYQSIFWKSEIIENKKIQDFFQLGNQKCIEYSFKWLQKYSKMSEGDKIVIGCSNAEQLTTSIDILQNKTDVFLSGIVKKFKSEEAKKIIALINSFNPKKQISRLSIICDINKNIHSITLVNANTKIINPKTGTEKPRIRKTMPYDNKTITSSLDVIV
jgi:aryl-alcohol dehydrogenase-like predicted oxidoreductase